MRPDRGAAKACSAANIEGAGERSARLAELVEAGDAGVQGARSVVQLVNQVAVLAAVLSLLVREVRDRAGKEGQEADQQHGLGVVRAEGVMPVGYEQNEREGEHAQQGEDQPEEVLPPLVQSVIPVLLESVSTARNAI